MSLYLCERVAQEQELDCSQQLGFVPLSALPLKALSIGYKAKLLGPRGRVHEFAQSCASTVNQVGRSISYMRAAWWSLARRITLAHAVVDVLRACACVV